jgi:ABC-2 type transport system permease protein
VSDHPGVATVYRWELRKLRSQKRTYLGLGAAAAVPIIFVTATSLRGGGPNDVPFGRYIHETGLAIPLVLLLFGSIWMFPLITALVAGDIVASEDGNGTLKTILTRSLERGQVFGGKLLAALSYAVAAIFLNGAVSLVAGTIASGFHPLVSLSGTTVSAPRGLLLVGASLLVYLIPVIAIACVGLLLSTITRNSAASVVGTRPDRLGAGRARGLGLHAVRGAGRRLGVPRVPQARRGRRLRGHLADLDAVFHPEGGKVHPPPRPATARASGAAVR